MSDTDALVTAVTLNGVIGVVAFALFLYLRPKFPEVFQPRCNGKMTLSE
jgi:hypothetical protein